MADSGHKKRPMRDALEDSDDDFPFLKSARDIDDAPTVAKSAPTVAKSAMSSGAFGLEALREARRRCRGGVKASDPRQTGEARARGAVPAASLRRRGRGDPTRPSGRRVASGQAQVDSAIHP